MHPLLLDLAGRRVAVVGAGAVAARRVPALLEAGALVHLVAPHIDEALDRLDVLRHRRAYRSGDLAEAWLALACTDDPAVNAAVAAEAEQRRIFCVRADDASGGTACTPAVARSGALTVAVNADDDPRRAAAVRDAIRLALDVGDLPVRPHRPAEIGRVALVGGGPGDEELITVRGRRLLAQADVVVIDRLAPRGLLSTVDSDVEVVEAGKAPGRHTLTQDEINAVLVDRATRGKRVVRLKGGDPYVFGRGFEEVQACVRAGVDVEVVPGITSALAGPAYAGIPVTHRGTAADFAVVSAHLDPSRPGATVDWQALADGPSTLVLLMAVGRLEQLSTELVKRGRAASTPVAIVQNATLPTQQVLVATLGDVAERAAAAGVVPPAVVVVGDVVSLREQSGIVSLREQAGITSLLEQSGPAMRL